jgi:hypothetical protein
MYTVQINSPAMPGNAVGIKTRLMQAIWSFADNLPKPSPMIENILPSIVF